jgi:hypothetical protein
MMHTKIENAYAQKPKFTHSKNVSDFHPQKGDLHCIQITPGGSLIKYKGNVSTQMADLVMLKLLRNSGISTAGAHYMCLNFFFLPNRCS